MTDKEPEDDDELPWNEEQWERCLRQSEARSARYGDLLETLMDHPDRDDIIDREMGWDQDDDEDDADDGAEAFDVEAMNEACEAALNDPEIERQVREEKAELEAMPAYRRAFDFGMMVHDALKAYAESPDEALAEDVGQACLNGHIIAAKLAGAHGMGYEDDVLCGAICVCKRSLNAAQECLAALERLRPSLPAAILDPLLAECIEVRRLVEERIAELRSRVWWE